MKKLLTLSTLFILGLIFSLTNINQVSAISYDDIDYTCSMNYNGAKLNFLNWGEYIDKQLIKVFESKCNAKVIMEEADSSETMKTKLYSGAEKYDLLTPSDYMIENFRLNNMLIEINFDNIPNYRYIDENNEEKLVFSDDFLNKPFDPNNQYYVPYFWGTVGIMYNKEKLAKLGVDEDELHSWAILWDERLTNNVFMYESHRDLFMVALKLLGYSVNRGNLTIDEYKAHIDEAKELLIKQKTIVRAYGTDNIKKGVLNGDAAVGVVYSGDYLDMMFELMEDGEEDLIGYIVPQEGSNMWIDGFVIPKQTDNQRLAEEFINFMLDPKVAYLNASYVGYSTPHTLAYELLKEDEDYRDLVLLDAYYPSSETLAKTEVYQDLGQELNEYLAEAFMSVKQEELTPLQIIVMSSAVIVIVGGNIYRLFYSYGKKKRQREQIG